jgi:hypothetical protein
MPTPQQEIDIYTRMMEQRKAELIREGVPEEKAEDQACSEIRQQIRNG